MPDTPYRLTDDFPAGDAAQWRDKVSAELKGKPWDKLVSATRAGLSIQPLYTADDWDAAGDPTGFPGSAPHTRGAAVPADPPAWDVRCEFTHPDPVATNAHILKDLSCGATSLLLRLDPTGAEGVAVRSADDLDAALAGVDLESVPLTIEAGARALPAADLMDDVLRRRGLTPGPARCGYQADPVGAWITKGGLPVDLARINDDMATLAVRTSLQAPHLRSVIAKSCPFHNAGADEVQELAFVMGEAVAYLRILTAAGLDIDAAAGQMQFCLAVDGDLFGVIAKLRAARRLWGRIVSASGGGEAAQRMRMVARTSQRMMTRRDPWVNILRTTTATFAAVTGGADAVTVVPFDGLDNVPDGFSRRIARNVQIILQEESHLGHVVDPAGGAWHLEARTDDLAVAAWALFQEIESRGGLIDGLRDGSIQSRVSETRAARERDVALRRIPVTGVSEFPCLDEAPVLRDRPATPPGEAPGALRIDGEDGTPRDVITPIGTYRTAESFEDLRDAADSHSDRTGTRPRVFLCALGKLAQYTARASWIGNALAAGGIELTGGEGHGDSAAAAAAFRASGTPVAVICSADDVYAEIGPDTAAALREAGAAKVILAGRFGDLEDRWKAAGVDQALYLGCDVLETLRDLHETLEVRS
jgi:methylmalonyl-CoA mutase